MSWLAMVTPAFLVIPLVRVVGARADRPRLLGAIRASTAASAGLLMAAMVPIARGALTDGLLVGIAGVAAIVGLDVRHTSGTGVAEMAVVVLGYAMGPWTLSRYLSDLPSLGVIAVSLGVTTVVYAPVPAITFPCTTIGPEV